MPGFVNYKKGCTRLAATSDKVYQLLAHRRWFSLASSTTKTGHHDIAEILLKVALKHQKSKSNQIFISEIVYLAFAIILLWCQRHFLVTDFMKKSETFVFTILNISPDLILTYRNSPTVNRPNNSVSIFIIEYNFEILQNMKRIKNVLKRYFFTILSWSSVLLIFYITEFWNYLKRIHVVHVCTNTHMNVLNHCYKFQW